MGRMRANVGDNMQGVGDNMQGVCDYMQGVCAGTQSVDGDRCNRTCYKFGTSDYGILMGPTVLFSSCYCSCFVVYNILVTTTY